MIYRIAEYHGIELKKYKLPIKHVVVYLGEKKPKMKTSLRKEEIFEGFTLVNTNSFSPEKWLEEDEPAKIIMAVLSDYQKKNAKIILQAIINKLRRVCETENDLKKFIKQLIIISRMRNLEKLTIKTSEEMPIIIDIEKDYLYNLGLKKADELVKQLKEEAVKAKKQAKIEAEKVRIETGKVRIETGKVRIETEKKQVKKMKTSNRFSDKEISEFLNIDIEILKQYLQEIEEK